MSNTVLNEKTTSAAEVSEPTPKTVAKDNIAEAQSAAEAASTYSAEQPTAAKNAGAQSKQPTAAAIHENDRRTVAEDIRQEEEKANGGVLSKLRRLSERESDNLRVWKLALLSAVISYLCLEVGNKNLLMNGLFYTPINILTVFSLTAAVYIIVRRWRAASILTGTACALLGTVNYYTLLYRNQPVSTQDIHNIGTSLDVLGSYKLGVSIWVLMIIALFGANIYVSFLLGRAEKVRKRRTGAKILHSACLIAFCSAFLFLVYFGKNPIKPRNTFVWSWEETYYKYGFAASSIEVGQNSMNPVKMPEGYSDNAAEAAAKSVVPTSGGDTPDVILILNETFYDLRDIADIETDEEFMPFIDRSDDLIKGRAVVAGTGGGTNKSEYELLTSNSIQLMPGITPFNYLDFSNANSVVSFLDKQGYTSFGAHCANSLNYSRGKVYPQLGFDRILFKDDFENAESYGKRWYATDESVYRKLIEEYEEMPDSPRFMYMLTIQNHGGWDLNAESEDTVHVRGDFGEYTDDINEYLSCIRKSDEAFEALTEYFADNDRHTIICMVGDHCPSFAEALTEGSGLERTMKLRSTPYVVWSNYELENEFPSEISMPFIVPCLLKTAGCEMSAYYEYMTELSKSVPVLTAFNVYRAADGKIYKYSDETEYKETVDDYFNLEYNNTGSKAKRDDGIFRPASQTGGE